LPRVRATPKTDHIPERCGARGMSGSDMISSGRCERLAVSPAAWRRRGRADRRNVAQYPVGAEPRDEGQNSRSRARSKLAAGMAALRVDGNFWRGKGIIGSHAQQGYERKSSIVRHVRASSGRWPRAGARGVRLCRSCRGTRRHAALRLEPPNVVNVENGEPVAADNGTIKPRRMTRPPASARIERKLQPEGTCPQYDAAIRRIFEKASIPRPGSTFSTS